VPIGLALVEGLSPSPVFFPDGGVLVRRRSEFDFFAAGLSCEHFRHLDSVWANELFVQGDAAHLSMSAEREVHLGGRPSHLVMGLGG
jgi:hypothetical protein